MLVFLKNDMSYTTVGGQRVYGKKFAYGSFGPTDIPLSLYEARRNIFEEAEYTKDWLEKKYACAFPSISFKLSELYHIDLKNLINIASCIGIKYHRGRKTTMSEKKALCRAIKKIISQRG